MPQSFRRPSQRVLQVLRVLAVAALAATTVVALSGASGTRRRSAAVDDCVVRVPDGDVAALAVPVVPRELRAAWVSPVEGGEWPSRPGMPPEAQRAELLAMLDRAAAVGLNAVVLHVRVAADALYPTARAPWSSYLTRQDPGYDPLAFAVAEAHRRGLQLHAWFNPFRAAPPDGSTRPGASFVARQHPEWVVRYGSQTWIDPGYPAARRAVLDAILEVVDRYDIDAVHLDDYFYPYQEQRTIRRRVGKGKRRHTVVTHETIEFADGASWTRFGRSAGFDSRGDWRRANVSSLVQALYQEVKARKPWVLVGISPFGIWRPGSPAGISGLDSYAEVFADTRRWLREGWLDYFTPQLYWQLDGAERRFLKLDAWWRTENVQGRHLWPGLFTMRVDSRGSPWPVGEIPAQIESLRAARAETQESLGHVHFRLASMSPSSPLGQLLTRDVYAAAALPPASPWLGATVPEAPSIEGCVDDASPLPIRVTKDAAPAPPDAAGAMAATPRALTAGAAMRVTPSGPTPSRWWLVQLRDATGRWSMQTLPGDLRLLPLALPNGERAAYV
ncbi:MAG: family 10 glycosylhydrolase, partial [Gemmatirosa sp.]|nr:family 10 glycosylhydrolase [Gemmatirosa sp.]